MPATVLRVVLRGSPFEISETSVLVPPISSVMRSPVPAVRAITAEPMIPPMGPECVNATGPRFAESNPMTPPFERIM